MMKFTGFVFSIFIWTASLAQAVELPAHLQSFEGKTFRALGPNCFGTAMRMAGITGSYRGMDEKEFRVIRERFCRPVEKPQPGDIGVFERPGFGFVHAYIYISNEWGLQKPGVDYNGRTPIGVQSLDSINYTFLASPECRRYSRDISECANVHYYIHCEPFQQVLIANLPELEADIAILEQRMDRLLEGPEWTSAEKKEALDLKISVSELRKRMQAMKIPQHWRSYIEARQVSLEKQMDFFSLKIR